LNVPAFDGHLDPKIFLYWLQDIDRCFTWYPFSEG